jgi:hypothetical protein
MAQTHVRIQDTALVRDIHSKAILNTDRKGLNDYLMKREIAKKQQEEQSETKLRLAKLEEDMSEIKSLLRDIAEMRKV